MSISKKLSWPGRGEATDESGLGGNRDYIDLRSLSWSEAQRVYNLEGELIARIENGEEPDEIEDELYEEPDHHLYGLDIGVASTVAAVSARRLQHVGAALRIANADRLSFTRTIFEYQGVCQHRHHAALRVSFYPVPNEARKVTRTAALAPVQAH